MQLHAWGQADANHGASGGTPVFAVDHQNDHVAFHQQRSQPGIFVLSWPTLRVVDLVTCEQSAAAEESVL